MKNTNVVENYYAVPADLIHAGKKEDILKLYGSLISSDKTKKINVYSSEVDWKAYPTNIALLLMVGIAGFLLSSANFYIALFTIVISAPFFHWRKVKGVISYLDIPQNGNKAIPLTETGKESLHDHLVEIGQIPDKF